MQRSYFGAGPLAAAASTLSEAPLSEPLAPADPAAFLARRMDLRGSVDLARQLAAIDRIPPATAADPEAALRLRTLVKSRFGELRAAIDRAFADPFQRRNKLPSAAQIHAALVDAGALTTRSGRPIAAAGEALWAPFAELYSGWLERTGYETRVLRGEIAPALQALGPSSARLERLDAALLGATSKGRIELVEKLIPGLARSFARGFEGAIASLPEVVTLADIELWVSPSSWIRIEVGRGHAVVLAVLAHERGLVEGLVGAAG